MQDMRVPVRHESRKTTSEILFAVREDSDTYEEAETSPGRDRWVLVWMGELQSLQKKAKVTIGTCIEEEDAYMTQEDTRI